MSSRSGCSVVAWGYRVCLRGLRPEDWRRIRVWEADEEILRYIGEKRLIPDERAGNGPAVLPKEEARRVGPRQRVLAIDTRDGEFIGYVELRDINWRQRSAELRVCIGEKSHWGRGYGTEAVGAFLRFSFSRFKLDYIFLRVYRSNVRAIRCYEKCGFTVEGILRTGAHFGHLEDIVLMGIRRSQVVGPAAAQGR